MGDTWTNHRPVSQARSRSAATSSVGTWLLRYDAVLVGTTSTWPPASTPPRARLSKNTS